MRNKISCMVFFTILTGSALNAQNIGINTTSPQATLDVRGTQRTGGINNYVKYDSATGRIEWVGASIFAPASQQIIKHSASSEGLYAGGGKLEYRNDIGNPVFFTNWNTGNGYFAGNLGIGANNPAGKLHVFAGSSGATPPSSNFLLESNGTNYMSFLSPDASSNAIWFSKPSSPLGGGIFYNDPNALDGFLFRANNVPRMVITNTGRVGIGLNNPLSKLHVYGEEGSPDGNAAAIELSNGATGSGLNNWYMRAGASGTNTPAGGFSIGDNNAYRFVIDNAGKIGIGTTIPTATLDLSGNLGNKINIWSDGTLRYGLGVIAGLFQIYAATGNDAIAFGTGSSASFTERMRIQGNGNVGIGLNNPQYPLDINGRMRLSGTNPNDPGIWLNDAGVDRAFVGLQNNNHVGFYGGIGWGLTMNTGTSALALNGNEGGNGKVLASTGGAANNWVSSTNTLFNNSISIDNSTPLTLSSSSAVTVLPGMTYTFSSAGNSKVLISFYTTLYTPGCSFCGATTVYLIVYIDGAPTPTLVYDIGNGVSFTLSHTIMRTVVAGNHTIDLRASNGGGPDVNFNYSRNLTIMVIPE